MPAPNKPLKEDALLRMRGIVKDFSGTRALDHVDFDVRRLEVHALIGENGAGKSTLMNVLAGRFQDYQGSIKFYGENLRITNPRQARDMGIAVIYQELSVLGNFTVAENIMLGDEKTSRPMRILDRASVIADARQVIEYLGFDLDPLLRVDALSTAQQCMVEIAAAVRRNVRLLVFDEPTASLGAKDVDKLFNVIKDLRNRGLGIVYISHRLAELSRIADRVTVLRDAKVVGTRNIGNCRIPDLTRMMLGHELAEVFPEKTNEPGDIILRVEGLTRPGVFENIYFELRAGEILGIAGLVGSGRSEIVRAIFGADKSTGAVEFRGCSLSRRSPVFSRKAGIAMIPENRKLHGNITGRSIRENLNISILDRLGAAFGFQSPKKLTAAAGHMITRMNIDPPQPRMSIESLSGGNQQKVIVGRWLATDAEVFIFDEPTQGIDVGTKSQIYRLIMELACRGRAIILISSEMIELAELADRILIVRHGHIVREMPGDEADEDSLFAECVRKDEPE